MDVFRREDVGNLLKHVSEELIGKLVAWAEQLVRHAACGADGHLSLVARQLREHADGGHLMSRHLNLGNNLHVISCGILHEVAHLLLRVIALVRHLDVVLSPARRRLLRELRVLLDLDAPCLVVHQVQVQSVELVARHLGDKRLQFLQGDECAGGVHHQLTHMRTRRILDGEVRNGVHTRLRTRSQQYLVERHQTPEHATRRLTLDAHPVGIHIDRVCLVVVECGVEREHHLNAALTTVHNVSDAFAEHVARLLHLVGQLLAIALLRIHVPRRLHVERLSPLHQAHLLRHGHQALCGVAHLPSPFLRCVEAAPSGSLPIRLLATLRYDELHASRLHTVERRYGSLGRHLRQHRHRFQSRQSCKGILADGGRALDGELADALTSRESGCADGLHRGRDGNGLQLIASEEGLRPNGFQNLWQGDVLDLMARVERVLGYFRALRLAEVDGAHLETQVAHLSIVAVAICRELASEFQADGHRLLFRLQVAHTCHGLCRHGSRQQGCSRQKKKSSHESLFIRLLYVLFSI